MSKKSQHKEAEPKEPPQQGMSIPEALGQAHQHWKAGQAAQAEALCQKVLQVWPGNPDALHLLGLIAYNWGNGELALDYVRKACQSPAAPAVYFSNLAEMCRQRQYLSEGEAAGRRAVALDSAAAGGWNNLGIILQEMGKYDESLICLERVIVLSPNYPEAHNNLGNTFKRLGRHDRAEACYVQAIALAPDYAEAHSNLSNLLKDAGEYERAAAEARRAIELNPRSADAYINLTAVEMARHNFQTALQWLDALLSFAPMNVMALSVKSNAFEKLDRLEEALEIARKATVIDPTHADAQNALGQALQATGKHQEALAAFQKAHDLHSLTPEQSHVNQATLLMEINRNDEAREALAKAKAMSPRSANVMYSGVTLKTFTTDDPGIAEMETLLASLPERNVAERILLYFALGKAWLDAGDAAKAFSHYEQGNRLKRSTIIYNTEATQRWVNEIVHTLTPQLMEKLDASGAPSQLPVFIVGMPRSGTTLIEQILASHSGVYGAGELPALQRIVSGPLGGKPFNYPQDMNGLSPQDIKHIGETYLAKIKGLADGHARVVDKMPANFFYAGLIALALPQARIIHCVRDPVDTCLSCYTNLFSAEQNFSYDLKELGHFYRMHDTLLAHWRSLLPQERYTQVQYEQVVTDCETEARRLVAFCGLPWDNACLEFYKGNRRVRTASMQQVRQPIYTRSVGKWKPYAGHLTPLLAALGMP